MNEPQEITLLALATVQGLSDALAAATARAEAAEAERDDLRALIAYIDKIAPRANKTCDEPGITLSEAARRQMAEDSEVQG